MAASEEGGVAELVESKDTDGVVGEINVHCEVLCFIQNKSQMIAFDDVIKICEDFYTWAEVDSARATLAKYLPSGRRITKPTGSECERIRKLLTTLLKSLLDSKLNLPVFYAVDLGRLPPVGVEHLDVSSLLSELTALRAEVRAMNKVKDDVCKLQQYVEELVDAKKYPSAISAPCAASLDMLFDDEVQFPRISDQPVGIQSSSRVHGDGAGSTTFATHATSLKIDGMKNVKKCRLQPVVGTSSVNKCVKSVKTIRTVDVFVSRLHPTTTAAELQDSVKSVQDDISTTSVTACRLNSKHADLYASFHVAITVDAGIFAKAIEKFMCADAWPSGVLIRRYFKPKNGRNAAE